MIPLDVVQSSPLFVELYEDELNEILQECTVLNFKPGMPIITEGEEGKDIFVVLRGVAVASKEIKGKDVRIANLGTGQVFGETILINENQNAMSVSAYEDTDILILDHDLVFGLFEKKPRIFAILLMNVARLMSKRLYHSKKVIKAIHGRVSK